MTRLLPAAFLLASWLLNVAAGQLELSTHDVSVQLYRNATVQLLVGDLPVAGSKLHFYVQHDDMVKVMPESVDLQKERNVSLQILGVEAGHSEIDANATSDKIKTDNIFMRVTVYKNGALDVFSQVIGWIYFVAWSISFYPQIYSNYKRHSVVGLNFDFLWLNVVGFILYGTFNLGLYLIPEIKQEYMQRHPRGLNPVQLNDIVFAVHATAACIVTITQCFLYDRGDQRVSTTAKSILGIFGVFLAISAILAAVDFVHWLDFLYYCSYVKLTITLIKYIPQAYMNYKRKSTVGWSIGNIFLDFTGGMLSMLQMILNAYNYDDWVSLFGDPTKFGLGLFSVIFDVFFILQHYVLYRNTTYEHT